MASNVPNNAGKGAGVYLNFFEHGPGLGWELKQQRDEELETGIPVTQQHHQADEVHKAKYVGRLREVLQDLFFD